MFQKIKQSRYMVPRHRKIYYGFYVFAAIAIVVLSLAL